MRQYHQTFCSGGRTARTIYHLDPYLESVRIPRWTEQHQDNSILEIHGFADASNRAYAAVMYLRVGHSSNDFRISLICAKTKVAPVKTLSIPRLELNAVVLLNRLLAWAMRSLHLSNVSIYGWTDSTIVLAWLSMATSINLENLHRKSCFGNSNFITER